MPNTVNLSFDVTKQNITRTDDEIIASGAVQTLIANFDFCNVWDNMYKYCRFEGGGGIYDVRIEDDKCIIPWEVVEAPNFTMACYGTKSTDVMLTTRKLSVKVYQSVNFMEPEPIPSTPSLAQRYEQYILDAIAAQAENDEKQAANDAAQLANNQAQANNNDAQAANDAANQQNIASNNAAVQQNIADNNAAVQAAIASNNSAQTANNQAQADNDSAQAANDAKIVRFENDMRTLMADLYGDSEEVVISNDTIDSLWADA